jgi:hypothetical protein
MANDVTKPGKKSFWDTKEGTTGMVFGVAALGGLGYLAYKLLPVIEQMTESLAGILFFGAISVGLIYVIVDGTLRNRLWLIYKLMMRALTYSIIKYDPIGVLRETQVQAKKRIKLVMDSIVKVREQVKINENTLTEFQRDEQRIRSEVEWMKNNGKSEAEIRNHASKLGRIAGAETRITKSYTLTKGFLDQLVRAKDALVTIDSDIDFEIDITEREYKSTNATSAAWRAMRSALTGGDDIDQLRNDTFAYLAEDYGAKLGQIESFMDDSQRFLESADMKNSMYEDEGMRLLEDLNSRDLLVTSKQQPQAVPIVNTANIGKIDYFKK